MRLKDFSTKMLVPARPAGLPASRQTSADRAKHFARVLILLLLALTCAMPARAVSGTYSDPGGGAYWANVWVSSISSGKSYGWCTGDDENTKMNEFRGFESTYGAKMSTENPWVFMKFRYNKKQSKDYDYKKSNQQIYVMLKDGSLHQIVDASASWSQTDKTWGLINCAWDGEWFWFRFAPNERGIAEVSAIQVESQSYYYQSNFWHSDYWFWISARFLKGVDFSGMSRAREAKIDWTAPDKVKVSADNSWLPSKIGNDVSNFNFTTAYNAQVVIPSTGKTYSSGSFSAVNRGSGSAELKVPTDQDFQVKVTRNTRTNFTFEVGGDVSQSLNENATQSTSFVNHINKISASFNQVEGTTAITWEDSYPSGSGEYQVYRTLLNESGGYEGNRELLGTTKSKNFTDNASRGLEYGKYYRYEVFLKRSTWGDVSIPTNPEPLTAVNAAEVRTSAVPVIPMHLVQDTTVTDEVKIDWNFGNVPKSESDITFKVHRIEPGGTITRSYKDVSTTRTAGKASFNDEKPASACERYGYFIQLDLAENKVHLYSDTIYAHVTGLSRVTTIDVTKGTKGTDVEIAWTAIQVGTKATLYDIQRRIVDSNSSWVSIGSEENTKTSYSYTDKTAEPGRYYEYRVVAYAPDCDGGAKVISNAMTDVGFARATGVVSGRVQFDTGTAVPDARVTLTCESDAKAGQFTHSRAVLEPGDAITLSNLADVVNDGKPFTLQMMVKPDRSADNMTLIKDPRPISLVYSENLSKYEVKMGESVIGKIPANEFSQITFTRGDGKYTTYIDGNKNASLDEIVSESASAFEKDPVLLINTHGGSLEGWSYSYCNISGDAFVTGNSTGYMTLKVDVPESLAGEAMTASVDVRNVWGASTCEVRVQLMDENWNLMKSLTVCNDKSTHDWQTYSILFTMPEGAKHLRYMIEGKDNRNWGGYYGPMFKNMLVRTQNYDLDNWVLCPDFTGNVDEIRLWDHALTQDEIAKDCDRVISGESEGLKALITFDEGLEEYAFDSSCTGGVPNGHHAIVGDNTRPSDIIPTEEQLSSYGLTNDKGEYEIRGIAFTGSGTRYSVAPTKGIHKFNPTSRSAFIGGTSLTINNVDFTDVSSFKVSGAIRYAGTTIPVDSVTFYVDGTPCNKNDKQIVSDANGEYEISVPIGNHYIEARRNGHTFADAGRYPAEEETYEFLEDTHIDFTDVTLATVAGRIVGGETQGKQPLGYGASENNIGQAEITLSPLDHPQRMLNAVETVDGTTVTWDPNPANVDVASASEVINSSAYRAGGTVDDVKYIKITTDAKTGEFSALLPPIRYRVESIKFANNPSLEQEEVFLNVPAINLTHPSDTIRPDTLYNENKQALPLFKCNAKLLLTYRSNPVMDISQTGAPVGAFGTDSIELRDAGQDVKLALYEYNENTKTAKYNYGYPIFQMGRIYNFKVQAYEPYINYDSNKAGKLYKDLLADSIITFDNEMGEDALIAARDTTAEGHTLKRGECAKLQTNQIQLDKNGEGTYTWRAGYPSLTAPFTRNMNASMVINKQTKLWSNDGLTGIIFGSVSTGNNFITAGPSHVQMVLRDPPGDASSATWATDSVTSDYTYTVRGVHNGTELGVDIRTTIEADFTIGTAFFGKMNYYSYIGENTVTGKYEVNKTWDNHTQVTYTNTQSTSTSSSSSYVGRDGDVFIGYSTNYIIGAVDKVSLFKQDDGSWGIGMEESMAMDEKFNTHFEYSQKFIETTMFDNIKRTRNSMIKHINSMSEIEENPQVPTYYTFLTEDDDKYGTSNNDTKAWGAQAKTDDCLNGPSYWARFPDGYQGCDSVMWCNEVIAAWKKTLAANEEDKLTAFGDAKYKIGNESFETGVTVTKSTGSTSKEVHNSVETFSTGMAYKGKNGFLVDKAGLIIISNTEIGYHQTKYDVDETTESERFSYTLNDTQRNNSHTVDVFNSPHNWGPIFRTRGGQTRCPYEGETKTKYYREGQTLDYATMKSDNPHISVPVRNIPDIPAGQEAQLQVVFTNESETHEQLASAVIYVDPASNPNGLQVFMDGLPILNSTELWIEYGSRMTKTLTIKQSDNSILDYENIRLILANSCNPTKWAFDTVAFSAHFVPAAPAITLKLDKNVLNQSAVASGKQVVTTISDINRMFTGLKGVRLKYRFAGDSKWTTAHEWFTDSSYFVSGQEATQSILPTDKPNIPYSLTLPNIDGTYFVAAESMCLFGNTEYTNTTAEQEVIRDTRGPKLLGHAYPNTGFLYPTDDIHIKFNEAIRESYLTKDENFFITGFLNGAKVDNQVSLQLNGMPLTTDAYIPMANTSFAASLWLKRSSGGTLLEHGTEGSKITLGITDEGKAELAIGDQKATSQEAIPADRWVFIALNYDKDDTRGNTFTMLLADEDREIKLFDELQVPDYIGAGQLTVGAGLHGAMHDLALWGISRNVHSALAEKDEVVAAYLPGLVGYWRMDEGHGTTVTDYARARNFYLDTERWNLENKSLAAHFDGEHNMAIDISAISPRNSDSYAIEFWFRGEPGKNAGKTLVSVTDKVSVGFGNDNSLLLTTYDQQSHTSLDTEGVSTVLSATDYSDGQWHHFALNVRRGIGAAAYVDGRAVKTLAEQDVPAPAGDKLYVGSIQKRDSEAAPKYDTGFFTGDIDELRVWNASIDSETLIANRYNEIDTANVAGLMAYFPMQKSALDDAHNIITSFSTDNAAPKTNLGSVGTVTATGITQAGSTPALKSSPLRQNLDFDFTASDNEIYITLKTSPTRMHGNLLSFMVKNVRDVADNLSEPITWSAKADYNTLRWESDKIEVYRSKHFDADVDFRLYNIGTESENYTISGLPSWLSINRTTGVLGVGASELFKITLDNAPIGAYTIPIYVSNNSGIYCTPLVLSVRVAGDEPEWYVNPDEYESSMNVIGQVYIKDKISTDTYTKVAAFVDGECRGVASPKLMSSRDAYFVNMTIYGLEDLTKTQNVTFRIYDASQGVVLNDVETTLSGETLNLTYRPNDIVGSFDSPVKWNATDRIEQWCALKTGWNWISLYAKPGQGHADLESVLGHNKVFNTIKGKEGFAMNSGSKWVSTGLDTLAIGYLYKVKMKSDANITITGDRIDTRTETQTIYPGWNWIGSLSVYNLSLGEAFADLDPMRGDMVKSKTQVAIYDGYKWEGELSAIVPGQGYYYKSNNDAAVTFRYPTLDMGTYSTPAKVTAETPARAPFTPVDHHNFSDNMNVVARVTVDDVPADTLTLAAFVGDECRGVTHATEEGLYLLTVAGNADEAGVEVTFATVINGEVVAVNEKLLWFSDVVYGDLDEPRLLTVNSSGIGDVNARTNGIQITPTLVRDMVNVRSGGLLDRVSVYTVGGAVTDQLTGINDSAVSINLNHLTAGVYFVEATTVNGYHVVKRIVKQ